MIIPRLLIATAFGLFLVCFWGAITNTQYVPDSWVPFYLGSFAVFFITGAALGWCLTRAET